jgi:ceramide glucosyltransferase
LAIIRDVSFLCACASVVYYVMATAASVLFRRRAAKPHSLPDNPPSVALLKPLHGCDDHLLANLKSFLDLDYPGKEYIFGITSEDDPAVPVLEEIERCYPGATISRTTGDEPSVNRKVGKLLRMLCQPPASELLVMSDADVRVDPDYLRRIVAEISASDKIGMVTCTYRGIAPRGSLGARLEALFINTDFTPTAILSYYVEPMRHAFAATVAIRPRTLDQAGGLEAVKNSFGDDFALARRVAAAGFKIELSSSIVSMMTEKMTLRDFWDHQMRWARVDRKIRPSSLARIAIDGPFWALLFMLASGFSAPAVSTAIAVFAARLGMAAWMLRGLLRLPLRVADLALTPVKDLIMQAVWLASLVGDTVEWRGRKLRLLSTGEMEEVP